MVQAAGERARHSSDPAPAFAAGADVRALRPALQKTIAVFVAFMGFAVGYACTYGSTSTTFILPLVKQFGWGRLVPSLMYVSAMLGVVIASLWLGRIIERLGEWRVAAISGALLAGVMVCLSLMQGAPAVALGLALLAGLLGAGTGVGLYVAILPKWFDRSLGRALGLAVMGQSAGSMMMPPISAAIIAAHGWRAAYRGLASIELVGSSLAAVLLFWLFRSRATGGSAGALDQAGTTPGEAVRQSSFWILQAAIFLQTVGMFGVSFHIFPIYHDLGVDWSRLPRITAGAAFGMAVGRLGTGLLLDRLDARLVAAGVFLIGAVAVAWLATLTAAITPLQTYAPVALVGVALGAETDILAFMARRFYGLKHYSVIYNRLLIGYFLGTMAGPLVLGWGFDHMAQPRLALWGLAACCCLAAAVIWGVPGERRSLRAD